MTTHKTYQAPTMSEALSRVKQELGRDAVIVRTRSVRKGWLPEWLGGRRLWEVTAEENTDQPRQADEGRYVAAPFEGRKEAQPLDQPIDLRPIAPALSSSFGEEVGRIRHIVEALLAMQPGRPQSDAAADVKALRQQLSCQEVGEELADELVSELKLQLTGWELADTATARVKLREIILQRLAIGGQPSGSEGEEVKGRDGRARVLALIGPTGVGKTTTIAKLAANLKIRERRKVGMITIDTYRIAAVDQLKTYAELVEVPLHVVLTPGELIRAIDQLSDCDVVLIDTAGRSQLDRLRLNQLGAFLRAAEPDDVSLVVSATSSRTVVASTLERFLPLGVNSVVMTKLDEATALGSVLNVSAASRLPIRYVTTGQDVPDDIFPADPSRLANCILEGLPYVA